MFLTKRCDKKLKFKGHRRKEITQHCGFRNVQHKYSYAFSAKTTLISSRKLNQLKKPFLKYKNTSPKDLRRIRVLFLSSQEAAELLAIEEVMEVVENAFKEKALGYTQMPPKSYLNFSKYNGDLRVMPAYLERLDVASVKIVNSHPENPKKYGVPTVTGTVLLVDPKTGALLSIMGANNITAIRTAAAGGIAAKYLAKKNSKILSFIGAGVQARAQLIALLSVFPNLNEIRVCDISTKAAETLFFVSKSSNF